MPNLDQAKKALRQDKRRRVFNDAWRAKLRAGYKAMRLAVAEGDKKKAEATYVDVSSVLDRAAKRNIIHPNKAARKKSRLAQAVAKLGSK